MACWKTGWFSFSVRPSIVFGTHAVESDIFVRNKCNFGGSFEIICNFGGFVVIMVGPGKNICNYSGSVVTLVGLVESAGQR